MNIELINKSKIKADDYITVLMVVNFGIFAIFFHLEALLAVFIYPFVSLIFYGLFKITSYFSKRRSEEKNPIKLLFGIVSIIVSIIFLWLILIQPNITPQILITLGSFPMIIVGYASIIKGIIINSYTIKHRIIAAIVGFITIIISLLIFGHIFEGFLFNIVILSLTLLFNIISRAALYLSEYGLSIVHIRNFKIFFYIISDYLIYVDRNGNLVLSKI